MKATLISIKPKWVAKILNGEKTIEIRKTCPIQLRGDTPIEPEPIDVYIYCTKDSKNILIKLVSLFGSAIKWDIDLKKNQYAYKTKYNGKVVAKFTLNRVGWLIYRPNVDKRTKQTNNLSCLTDEELDKYLNKKDGYAWFIENLVIFDRPKDLSEFYYYNRTKALNKTFGKNTEWRQRITHAPQSWCYVEVK